MDEKIYKEVQKWYLERIVEAVAVGAAVGIIVYFI